MEGKKFFFQSQVHHFGKKNHKHKIRKFHKVMNF